MTNSPSGSPRAAIRRMEGIVVTSHERSPGLRPGDVDRVAVPVRGKRGRVQQPRVNPLSRATVMERVPMQAAPAPSPPIAAHALLAGTHGARQRGTDDGTPVSPPQRGSQPLEDLVLHAVHDRVEVLVEVAAQEFPQEAADQLAQEHLEHRRPGAFRPDLPVPARRAGGQPRPRAGRRKTPRRAGEGSGRPGRSGRPSAAPGSPSPRGSSCRAGRTGSAGAGRERTRSGRAPVPGAGSAAGSSP